MRLKPTEQQMTLKITETSLTSVKHGCRMSCRRRIKI